MNQETKDLTTSHMEEEKKNDGNAPLREDSSQQQPQELVVEASNGSQKDPIVIPEDDPVKLLDEFSDIIDRISKITFQGPPVDLLEAAKRDNTKEKEKQFAEWKKIDQELTENYKDEISDVLLQKEPYSKEDYPELGKENYNIIKQFWASNDDNRVVAKHDYIPETLSVRNLKTLRPRTWLNDEVINAYLKLIIRREATLKNRIHIFNTFFFGNLEKLRDGKETFDKIARMTRRAKVNISECSRVFIPVHANGNHWVFIEADIENRKVIYQDSMFISKAAAQPRLEAASSYLNKLLAYEKDPDNFGKRTDFDDEDEENLFTEEVNASYPKQDNSSDCGIFMLKGIEFGSRLAKRTFTCKDTVYLRYLIAFELYTGNLLS